MATVVHDGGRALSSRMGYRLVLGADALAHAGLLVWAIASGFTQRFDLLGFWGLVLYVVAVVGADLGAIALNSRWMTMRRRMAFVALIGVLWRGSPFNTLGWQVAATLDAALVWIAILVEGRRVSRSVAEATGEQMLSVDPTRPDR